MKKTNSSIRGFIIVGLLSTPLFSSHELFDPNTGPLVWGDAVGEHHGNASALALRPSVSVVLPAMHNLPSQTVQLFWREPRAIDEVGQGWDISGFRVRPNASTALVVHDPMGAASHTPDVYVARRDRQHDSTALRLADRWASHTRGTTPLEGHDQYFDDLARDNRTYSERSCDANAIELRKLFLNFVSGLEQFTDGYTAGQLEALFRVAQHKLSRIPDTAVGQAANALIPLIRDVARQAEALRDPLTEYLGGALHLFGGIVDVFDAYIDRRTDPFPGYKLRDSVMDHVENTDFGTHNGATPPTTVRVSVERIDLSEMVAALKQVNWALDPILRRNLSGYRANHIRDFLAQVDHLHEERIEGDTWDDIKTRRQRMGLPAVQYPAFTDEIRRLAEPVRTLLPLFERVDQRPENRALEGQMKRFLEGVRNVGSILDSLKSYLDNANKVVTATHDLHLLRESQTSASTGSGGTGTVALRTSDLYAQQRINSELEQAKRGAEEEARLLQHRVGLVQQYLAASQQAVLTGGQQLAIMGGTGGSGSPVRK